MVEKLEVQVAIPEEVELRRKNVELVEKYIALQGVNCIEERLAMFTDDIVYEIVNTKECVPQVTVGKNRVRQRMQRNNMFWKDFKYTNALVSATQFPDVVFVECDGEGLIHPPIFSEPHPYENYYILYFKLRDGKIKDLRQFTNPLKLMHDYWKIMPDWFQ